MSLSVISSVCVTAVGLIYTISALMLPAAAMGRPNEPKIFPALLGFSLIILGFALVIQEILNRKHQAQETADGAERSNGNNIKFGKSEKQIALTLLNGLVYSLLFNPIGYIISTILFLTCELFIFDGPKIWKKALLIAIIFSVVAYVIFDLLLGIYLPKSPLGIF